MEVEKKENNKNDDLVVHVMPKRYSKAKEKKQASSSKGGLFVMIFGFILMLGLLGFLYFYLVKEDSSEIVEVTDAVMEEDVEAVDNNQDLVNEIEEIENDLIEEKDVVEVGEENEEDMFATTSEIIVGATTTNEIQEISLSATTTKSTTTKEIVFDTEKPIVFDPGDDIDSDGLSDIEEILLGSDTSLFDSDGDGYDDLSEILKLYDPIGKNSIIDNINVSEYINNEFSYRLYYPFIWSISKFGGEESIMFKLDNEQFIQVIVQENINKQKITEWYEEQIGTNTIKISQLFDKNEWSGIRSENGLIVYMMDKNEKYIFTLTYNLGLKNTLDYKNIFEMMVNSLEIIN